MQDASYVEIPVYARDGSLKTRFKVDIVDAPWVQQYRWKSNTTGHITRNVTRGGKSVESIHIARAILGLRKGDPLTADHINRDPTDNRRANLRAISVAAQNQNRHRKGSSQYRGVVKAATSGRWIAHVYIGGKNHHLGTFDDEAEAARIAKEYRLKHHPYAVD